MSEKATISAVVTSHARQFSESGVTAKALEAATLAKQWGKAAQIADALEDSSTSKKYYGKIAQHYASSGDPEVRQTASCTCPNC